MDVSKLALSLLVPNLGQLGHVHLYRFISVTERKQRGEEQRQKKTTENQKVSSNNITPEL